MEFQLDLGALMRGGWQGWQGELQTGRQQRHVKDLNGLLPGGALEVVDLPPERARAPPAPAAAAFHLLFKADG